MLTTALCRLSLFSQKLSVGQFHLLQSQLDVAVSAAAASLQLQIILTAMK